MARRLPQALRTGIARLPATLEPELRGALERGEAAWLKLAELIESGTLDSPGVDEEAMLARATSTLERAIGLAGVLTGTLRQRALDDYEILDEVDSPPLDALYRTIAELEQAREAAVDYVATERTLGDSPLTDDISQLRGEVAGLREIKRDLHPGPPPPPRTAPPAPRWKPRRPGHGPIRTLKPARPSAVADGALDEFDVLPDD